MAQDRDPEVASGTLVEEGDKRLAAGDYDGALESADAALANEPKLASALSLRASALDGLDAIDEARASHEEALRAAPRELDVIADAAEFYLRRGSEDGDDEWVERARKLAALGTTLTETTHPDVLVEFALLESDALLQLGAPERALSRIDEALRALHRAVPEESEVGVPEKVRLEVERGRLLFESCRFDEARGQLESVLRLDSSNAAAHHALGLVIERAGDAQAAASHFAQAHASAPEEFPLAIQFSAREFDRAVEAALEELPPQIRDYLSNVAITVDDVPADSDLFASQPPLSPTILGLFRGSPVGDKASMDPWSHFPSSIVLYQRNLERFAESRDDLVDEIRVTLVHEVGHFVGLDEDQLWDLGVG